jgi:hypothetical protein
MKRLSVVLAFAAMAAMSTLSVAAASSTVEGWISDSKCGAKNINNAACVKKCIGEGSKPVFVDDATKTVWTIDNPAVVEGHYGHHVIAVANVDKANHSVHIASLTMAKDQGTPAKAD